MCVSEEKKIWPSRLFIHDIKERSHAAAGVISTLLNSLRKKMNTVTILICSNLIFGPFRDCQVCIF